VTLPSFNLVDEPWIPVVDLNGRSREVGLRELFREAHISREVVDDSPLSEFAMMRLLGVITHRIIGGPSTNSAWKQQWRRGQFEPAAVDAYFDSWRHRFDLYDVVWPFFQVGGFETISKDVVTTNLTSRLLPELATGNNPTLFDHTLEDTPRPFSPAQAARALLVAQTFSLGGGKGPTSRRPGKPSFVHPYASDAPGAGGVAVYVRHDSLYHTLSANLPLIGPDRTPPHNSDSDDIPTWERTTLREAEVGVPTGYLELCSWPSRFIRLIPDPDGQTTRMYFAQGAKIDSETKFSNPHAFWVEDEKRGIRSVPLYPGRAVWRDSAGLFALSGGSSKRIPPFVVSELRDGRFAEIVDTEGVLDLVCIGLANDKANPLLWRKETIPASARLLKGDGVIILETALEDVESIWKALRAAVSSLAYALLNVEGKSPDTKDVRRLQDRVLARVEYWERMESLFHDFLDGLDETAHIRWKKAAEKLARQGLARAASFAEGNVARVGKALAAADRKLNAELAKLNSVPPSTAKAASPNDTSKTPEAS